MDLNPNHVSALAQAFLRIAGVGMIPALLPPHNLAHATPLMGRVPALGEHTDQVLRELRFL